MEIKQLPCKTSIHKQLRWNELKISIFLEVREIHVPDLVDANQSGPAVVKQKQAGQCDPFHRQKRVARNTALPHIPLVLILLTA